MPKPTCPHCGSHDIKDVLNGRKRWSRCMRCYEDFDHYPVYYASSFVTAQQVREKAAS